MGVGGSDCPHCPGELLRIPPVGEEINVLAQPVHQTMRLQGVAARQRETKFSQSGQTQSHEALLKVVHR